MIKKLCNDETLPRQTMQAQQFSSKETTTMETDDAGISTNGKKQEQ